MSTIQFVLRLKAWVVFACLVGYPLVYELGYLSIVRPTSENIPAFVIGLSPAFFCYLFWILSILRFMPRTYQAGNSGLNNLALMSIMLIIVYAVMSYALLVGVLTDGLLISGVHLVTMVSFFFTIFYTGYLIKSAETNRRIAVTECLVEFLLIWIFPIGIWVLQPRLNKLAQ